MYLAHVQEWRQQFQKLESVDLRYDKQVIVNPDSSHRAAPAAQKPAAKPAAPARRATRKRK